MEILKIKNELRFAKQWELQFEWWSHTKPKKSIKYCLTANLTTLKKFKPTNDLKYGIWNESHLNVLSVTISFKLLNECANAKTYGESITTTDIDEIG